MWKCDAAITCIQHNPPFSGKSNIFLSDAKATLQRPYRFVSSINSQSAKDDFPLGYTDWINLYFKTSYFLNLSIKILNWDLFTLYQKSIWTHLSTYYFPWSCLSVLMWQFGLESYSFYIHQACIDLTLLLGTSNLKSNCKLKSVWRHILQFHSSSSFKHWAAFNSFFLFLRKSVVLSQLLE